MQGTEKDSPSVLATTEYDEEKVEFLKLILSNQKVDVSSGDKNNVSVENDLKKPFKKLAQIKKANSEELAFLKWCALIDDLRTAIVEDFEPLND